MKLLGALLALAFLLAALRTALAALLAVGLLAFGLSLVRAPGETLSVLAGLIAIGAFAAHPVAGFTFLTVVAILSALAAK
ncbi:hypothetical protein SAMN04488060_0023 [Qipengyuania nanhaisediminis]|uniref:Uncharacterized protein n=1 Tax=Qipengyuania nanhaisediminis TaxID=604088 RepID=A0A1I5KAU9_9SPHN|nr:hypothetical protein SAMN04488060_0023 [Qipengyuania nanhaisediminis]